MDTHLKWAPAYYRHTYSVYGLLTKRGVKMAGHWPSSFFVYLSTEMKPRSINIQQKNEANIQPSRPNKLGQYRIYYMETIVFFWDTARNPEQVR